MICRRRLSEGAEPVAAAAARAQKRSAAREHKREVRRRRREHYERGCTWGRPAASILYSMAREMHMETNYMLWCAASPRACLAVQHALQAVPLLRNMQRGRQSLICLEALFPRLHASPTVAIILTQ